MVKMPLRKFLQKTFFTCFLRRWGKETMTWADFRLHISQPREWARCRREMPKCRRSLSSSSSGNVEKLIFWAFVKDGSAKRLKPITNNWPWPHLFAVLVTAAVNLIPVTESRVARVVPSLPLSSLLGRGDCYLLHKWCGNDSSSCVHIAVPKYNLRSCCPLCQISFWMKTNNFLYKAFYWWYYNIFQKQFIDGSRFRWRWLLRNIRGNIFSPAHNWGYCLNIAKIRFWGFIE